MMKSTYSEAFKEQALQKVFQRGNRSVRAVARELNVNYFTLKGWMNKILENGSTDPSVREKRPQDWTLDERLTALQESHGLEGEALNAWCREKGLFVHHLVEWKAGFCNGAEGSDSRASVRELRALKEENQRLSRELTRKEKALAEAAALLVLQKKFQALWGDGVE
jgi:transposase-like protein